MNKLAIIILNYNTYKMTLNLITELQRILPEKEYEIIVIDNASPNESAKKLQEAAEKDKAFVFLSSTANGGYAAGNNIGLRYAEENGYEYSLVINNDIEIDSFDQISRMINIMDHNEKIGAVSPRIIGKDGKKDPPIYFKKPTFWDLTFGIRTNKKQRFAFNEDRNVRIYAPRGSCMLLRNSAMTAIDNLDEKTFLYYEEPILAERLEKKGYVSWLCGDSEVVHNHAVTISKTINKKKIIQTISKSYGYYLKQYRKFNGLQVAICVGIRKLAIAIGR